MNEGLYRGAGGVVISMVVDGRAIAPYRCGKEVASKGKQLMLAVHLASLWLNAEQYTNTHGVYTQGYSQFHTCVSVVRVHAHNIQKEIDTYIHTYIHKHRTAHVACTQARGMCQPQTPFRSSAHTVENITVLRCDRGTGRYPPPRRHLPLILSSLLFYWPSLSLLLSLSLSVPLCLPFIKPGHMLIREKHLHRLYICTRTIAWHHRSALVVCLDGICDASADGTKMMVRRRR